MQLHIQSRDCHAHAQWPAADQSSMASNPSSMKIKRRRLQCSVCKETLSYSAYCRHQQFQSCQPAPTVSSEDNPERELDDFISTESQTTVDDANIVQTSHYINPGISSSSSDSNSDVSDKLAPEIWDIDSDNETELKLIPMRSIRMYVTSLAIFQLCYRV